jgi:CO/xanthine dehydrogenase FAD-binding subunit
VAAISADTVPVLISLGAILHISTPSGNRTCPLGEFYRPDGVDHLILENDEILHRIEIPLPDNSSKFAYRKWAVRKSIDFPLVSLALRLDLDKGKLGNGLAVVGVLGPVPRTISLESFAGKDVDISLAEQISEFIARKSKPLPNVPYNPNYRRIRLGIEAKRAIISLVSR